MRSARQRIRDVLLAGMALSGDMAYWPTVGEVRSRGMGAQDGQEESGASAHRRRRRRRRNHSEATFGGDQDA